MKKFLTTLGILLLISFTNLNAQPGFDDDVEDTPLDRGTSILILSGAVYGLKKMKENKHKPT